MRKAMAEAGIKADEISYVNAHATSTAQGDQSELHAIRQIFNGLSVAVSATKSMTGHLLGAAGAIESIICALSVKNDRIPATINTTDPDDHAATGLHLLLGKSIKSPVNYALNNTFGFGGHVASSLFKKYEY
jgi:3-oxoacyl-[acyl-carrier-protein] synthase II